MINVKTFVFNPFQVNTYVVSDENGQCAIIDPACSVPDEFKNLREYMKEKKLSPTSIILTHGHVDHLLGLSDVAEFYHLTPIIHRDELPFAQTAGDQAMLFGLTYKPYTGEWKTVVDNEKIFLGQTEMHVFTISGHSPAGIALYCPLDKCVFTGDALFKGSIGRTDLPGGDYATLIIHIKEKLLTLPRNTMAFPGHGPYTTIEYELKYNPFLS